jgi:hypothetical protein
LARLAPASWLVARTTFSGISPARLVTRARWPACS